MPDAGRTLEALDGVRAWKLRYDSPPLFIEPLANVFKTADAFLAWVEKNFVALSQILVTHGGIVFRGFPLKATEDFDRLVKILGPSDISYAGGAAQRSPIKGDVYEATRLSPTAKLQLHQEMMYLREGPGRVVFFCRQPAEQGGETFIGDMRRLTQALPPDLRDKLTRLNTIVIRNYAAPLPEGAPEPTKLIHPDQRTWTSAFYTRDRAEVERVCAEKGMEPIWHDDNSLTTKSELKNFKPHPVTGEPIFHSVAYGHSDDYIKMVGAGTAEAEAFQRYIDSQKIKSRSVLSDGSEMPKHERDLCISLLEQHEFCWPWQAGDIMLLDNLLVGHGRYAYAGGKREVQVGLLR